MDLSVVATIGAVVAFGVVRVVYSDFLSREARVKRRLAERARVSIAKAQDGLVRLTGRAHSLGELLHAPVSQRPCISFQVVVRMRDSQGLWNRVLELNDARPFVLTDESGQAVIDGAGPSSISLVPDRRASTPLFRLKESADVRIARSLLRSADVETETIFGREKPVRFSEAVLLPGTRVSVSGRCTREVAPDGERAGYRDVPQRLVVRGTAEEPLLISNWRGSLEERG